MAKHGEGLKTEQLASKQEQSAKEPAQCVSTVPLLAFLGFFFKTSVARCEQEDSEDLRWVVFLLRARPTREGWIISGKIIDFW